MQLFGDDIRVKVAGHCFYEPFVKTWMLLHQDLSNSAVCYGMAASSLALTNHVGPDDWNDPEDIDPGSKQVSGIRESYANQSVAFYHVSQTLYQFNKELTKYEPDVRSIINRLYNLFESQDPPILIMAEKMADLVTPLSLTPSKNTPMGFTIFGSMTPTGPRPMMINLKSVFSLWI